MQKDVKMRKKGFTMIEMLVVISIIGLLAAILMPTITTARRKAREAATRGDIQAISTAASLFRTDTGMYPPDTYDRRGPELGVQPVFSAVRYQDQFAHRQVNDVQQLQFNDSTKSLVYFLGSQFIIDGRYYGPYVNFDMGRLVQSDVSDAVYRWCGSWGHRAEVYGITGGSDQQIHQFVQLRCLRDPFGSAYIYDCHNPEGVEIQEGLSGVAHNEQSYDLWSMGWDQSPFMGGPDGGSEPDRGLATTYQQQVTAKEVGNDIVNWDISGR